MKTIITALSLFAALVAFSANADVKLQDNSKILGKWRVNAESLGLDREKKALNISWEFQNNGTLITTGEDTLGRTSEMVIPIKYSVENGVIRKQSSPGREKYEDCTVIELSGSDMVLKCKGIYTFMTRK
ncbi:MAG: hypothetical protein PHW13_06140 [Methylococcales bacterium]|nr:hypothetical protein [Methylococcales bacterium]